MYKVIAVCLIALTAFGVVTAQTTTPCIENPGTPNPVPNPAAAAGGYIVLGNMGQPNVFSVSLWVNPSNVQNPESVLMDCNHADASNWVIQSIDAGVNWTFLNCTFGLQANKWQHLLCTYNNGLAKVFVDGKLQSQCNWIMNWNRPPFDVYLGNWPVGGRRFSGSVDEVYITANILAEDNFAPLELVADADILPNTVGLWHFDEAAGLVSRNVSSGVDVALNNWIWTSRTLTGPFKPSYQIAADLIEFGAPVKTRLLIGSGGGVVIHKMPSSDGTLAVAPMNTVAPVGTVAQFTADPVPSGYIKSHGQSVSRSQYSELFNRTGTTYGAGNGSTTFTLPDAGPIPTDGLVGWWPFNGNANDESGNGFNGVVNGATVATDRFGYSLSAYSFDGDDWIEVAHDPKLVSAAGSVSVWFRTTQLRDQNVLYKVAKQTALNEAYAIGWYNTPTKNLHGAVKFNSQCKAWLGWVWSYPQSTYTDNAWHHLVMTWGDGAVKMYIDGILASTGVSPVNPADVCNGGPVIIGGTWVATNGSFGNYKGEIDDIAIYNRILTEADRARLFGADSPRLLSIIKH